MLSLSKNKDSHIVEYEGITFVLDMTLSNIMFVFEMLADDELSENEKHNLFLDMLILNIEDVFKIPVQLRGDFMLMLLNEKLGGNSKLNEYDDDTEADRLGEPIFDFNEDTPRIHASFLLDYSIDLLEVKHTMLFETFMTLLENLSEDTPFKQAIYYRTCDIPKRDKHNKDDVKRIVRLKEHYALKNNSVINARKKEENEKTMSNFLGSFL